MLDHEYRYGLTVSTSKSAPWTVCTEFVFIYYLVVDIELTVNNNNNI